MIAFIVFFSLLQYSHCALKKAWILGNFGESCDYVCSTYFGAGCSPDATWTYSWPTTGTAFSTNILPTVLSYNTLAHISITCDLTSSFDQDGSPVYYVTAPNHCYFPSVTPLCSTPARADFQRFCPCAKDNTLTYVSSSTMTLTSNTDVLMVDFDATLSGGSYSCVNINAASTSGSYTQQIGFNFKMVPASAVPKNIMEIFFIGGGQSYFFGGPGNNLDFANNSLASYPASFDPLSYAVCMGSYSSGPISLPAGFTKICIGNANGGMYQFTTTISVQFIGQLQLYGFKTTTAAAIPATIPACQVVGGGYYLTGVLTKDPCPPGQYSMGGVLSCTPCERGKYTSLYGQTSCSSCSAGTYQNSTGSSQCLSCPTGKYQSSTEQLSCISCSAGKYNSATGSTSSVACVACSAGTFNNFTAQSDCSSCPTGTYSASTGYTYCLTCPAGKYNAGSGATECTNCPAGYYKLTTGGSSISSCIACPAGYYSSATGLSTTCTPCPAYTKNALTGQSSLAACVSCPLHTLNPYTGQSSCLNHPTSRPTSMPSITLDPTPLPTSKPSAHPTRQPTRQPTFQPFFRPTRQPTRQPSGNPSSPSTKPTGEPSQSKKPTTQPTRRPTRQPSRQPSKQPSSQPTRRPTTTPKPSSQPSRQPTHQPSRKPSSKPSTQPSQQPSSTPTRPTSQPSSRPSLPSTMPTVQPSKQPIRHPTVQPSKQPSKQPTRQPIRVPTKQPSRQPSHQPSVQPSRQPTTKPTNTRKPTPTSTFKPTYLPTSHPSVQPTGSPTYTKKPTTHPSKQPTILPSSQPIRRPTNQPSEQPTQKPSMPTGQPTGKPTYQPTSQPTFVPTHQPTRQPSRQPSRQPTNRPSNPSSQPTNKPSAKSTSKPTAKPTLKKSSRTVTPSVPSSQPTRQPSMPTSRPTKTYFPTIKASPAPTSKPTSRPTSISANTRKPTQYYTTIFSNGTIQFSPDEPASSMCAPVQLTIIISFSKTLITGSTFTVSTPGITSGDCYSPVSGNDISSIYLPAQSGNFTAAYYEGDIRNNFEYSYITFTLLQPIAATTSYEIVIDRSNLLRRSCSANSTWAVSVTPSGAESGHTGSLFRIESYPKKCFQFYSSLNFSNPHQQFPNGVNLTLYLAFQVASDMTIKVALPGFTNKMGGYGLNPTVENGTDYVGAGATTSLCNLTWNSNFSWTGTWYEGSVINHFKDSYFQLYAGGNYKFHKPFWVNIDRACNHLVPVCGAKRNSSAFTFTVTSDYFNTDVTPVTVSNPIGSGCDTLNKCNGNGVCNYCWSKCDCFDGYGSVDDLKFTTVNDFNPDCSSKACPRGRAIGNIFQNNNATNATLVSPSNHKQLECSANGLCDRSTGQCKCNVGFEGANCGRMVCPGAPRCSGRGRCLSMRRLTQFSNALPLSMSTVEYVHQFNDSTWDADFGHMCLCDSGWKVGLGLNQTQQAEYFGPACQYRHCPTGDDPMTTSVVETDCEGLSMTGGSAVGLSGNLCHVDCSNRGTCDFNTGICSCFPGYTGHNCGKLAY